MKDNKIVKNTIYLYVRMIISSLIGLLTSRVILKQLGIVDYGIYNVVFGLVVLMGFMLSSMTVSVQRYLSYHIGLNNLSETEKVLNISIILHLLISFFVLLFSESVGYFLFKSILNIPESRLIAAKIIYQFCIAVFVLSIIRVPFEALMNSYENFKGIATLGILESILRLGAAYLLILNNGDKLILYSINILIVSIIVFVLYIVYSLKKISIKIRLDYKLSEFKELLTFSSWNLLGGISNMLKNQGLTILINFTFGPTVNAAQGIANQVLGIVSTLSNNVAKAVNPQIVQNYAKNEMNKVLSLAGVSAKITSYLLIYAIIPIILYTESILSFWLGEYPIYTPIMIKLVLIASFLDNLSNPIMIVYQSYGKLRKYQLIISGIIILYLPITFVTFQVTCNPSYCYIISIILSIILLFTRLLLAGKNTGFDSHSYICSVVLRVCGVFIIAYSISAFIKIYLEINNLILGIILTMFCTTATILSLGINRYEKSIIYNHFKI